MCVCVVCVAMEEVSTLLIEAESDANLVLLSKGKIPAHIRTGFRFDAEANQMQFGPPRRNYSSDGLKRDASTA